MANQSELVHPLLVFREICILERFYDGIFQSLHHFSLPTFYVHMLITL